MTPPLALRHVPGAPDDIALVTDTDTPAPADPDRLAMLSDAERARADAYRFAAHRDLFVHAHVVQRRALSLLAPDVPPAAWRFDRPEANGKPFALGPDGARGPMFSLTHCEGLVGVALSTRREVGLDAEQTGRRELSLDLARSSFAPVEARGLAALPDADSALARLWCGKEALSKALGLGLALDFATLVIDPHSATILQTPDSMDARDWAFTYPEASAGHTLALAWHGG